MSRLPEGRRSRLGEAFADHLQAHSSAHSTEEAEVGAACDPGTAAIAALEPA